VPNVNEYVVFSDKVALLKTEWSVYSFKIVAFNKNPCIHRRRNRITTVLDIVVIVHMHGVSETHARMALNRPVEPVVMISHAQMPCVLGRVTVTVPNEGDFVMIHKRIPRHSDEIRRPLDVNAAVIPVVERVVINPHVC
jgi:hypothetical protein